jgi:hypothetical protein
MAPSADSDFDSLLREAQHIRQQAGQVLRDAQALRSNLERSWREMRQVFHNKQGSSIDPGTNGRTPTQQP